MLKLPPDHIEVIHYEGAGCYGHNGADDAALDAALVAMALPGRSVLLKWTRITSYNVCYTKLLRESPRLVEVLVGVDERRHDRPPLAAGQYARSRR